MTGSQNAEAGPNSGGPALIEVPPLLDLFASYADGRFQVTERIAVSESQDREVYRATDWYDLEGLGQVALKVYQVPDEATSRLVDREIAAHQDVESRSGILALRGAGILETDDGAYRYMATPFSPKGTLLDRIKEQPPDLATAINVAAQILPGLAAVHRRGMVHLDVKPGNIVAGDQEGEWDLTDFGIVEKFENFGPELPPLKPTDEKGFRIVKGSPGFAASEVLRGQDPGPEADIFGLAATVYVVATGKMPYESNGLGQHWEAVTNESPVPISALNSAVPADLSKLIMAGLSINPDKRPSLGRFTEVVMATASAA